MGPLTIHRTNTILYCNQWDATVKFYRDKIKLPVLLQKTWFVEFQLGDDACLSVADAARTSVGSAGGAGITLSWNVKSIDCAYDRRGYAGVKVTPIKGGVIR